MTAALALYGGRHPHDRPVYGYAAASHVLGIPGSTLRSWILGTYYTHAGERRFFEPLIALPDPDKNLLSFHNLVECHVLRSLRIEHSVQLQNVRNALSRAEEQLGINHLLRHQAFRVSGRELFLDTFSKLESLSPPDQYAMRTVIKRYLKRIEWEAPDMPNWFKPFSRTPPGTASRDLIGVNPRIRFGRPVIRRRGISTVAIYNLYDAGESKAGVMREYEITDSEFEEAFFFEKRAA